MRFADIILSLLPELILIVAWIVAVVFAARMIKGGGRPELLLLIGVCLMLAGAVISVLVTVFFPGIVMQLAAAGAGRMSIAQVMGIFGIVRACISLAGIVLIVLAFWKKFKGNQPVTAAE